MSTLYTARTSCKEQVLASMRSIKFPRGESWTAEDAARAHIALNKSLKGVFHPFSGSGHSKLATRGSDMAGLKSGVLDRVTTIQNAK